MKDLNQYQEIQLELPHMKTGFYVYMNKYSMDLPDTIEERDVEKEDCNIESSETQLSLAI
jgi:hypothetical protein